MPDIIIKFKTDSAELRKIEAEYKAQLQRQVDAEKTTNRILIEQERQKTAELKAEYQKSLANYKASLAEEVSARKRVIKEQLEIEKAHSQALIEDAKRTAQQHKKLSGAQLLEMGENVTVLAYGISQAIGAMKEFVSGGLRLEQLRGTLQLTADNFDKIKQASGGLVEESRLIELTNQASSFNNSIEQQQKLWKAARLISRETGRDEGEVFQGLIKADEGLIRGLLSSNVSRIEYNKILKDTVQHMGGLTEEETKTGKSGEIVIKNLSAENEQRARQEAMLTILTQKYGSLDVAQTTNYEKTQQLSVAIKNAKDEMGLWAGKTMVDFISSIGLAGDKSIDFTGKLTGISVALLGILPALAQVKAGFGTSFLAMGGYLSVFAAGVLMTIDQVKTAIGVLKGDIPFYSNEPPGTKINLEEQTVGEEFGTITPFSPKQVQKQTEEIKKQTPVLSKHLGTHKDITKEIEKQKETYGDMLIKAKDFMNIVGEQVKLIKQGLLSVSPGTPKTFGGTITGEVERGKSPRERQDELNALTDEFNEKIKQGFEQSVGLVQHITSLFGLGDTIFGQTLGKFMEMYQIMQEVVALIQTIQAISSFLSLIGLQGGGEARAGHPYIIGEHGAELFVPKQSGVVIPNDIFRNRNFSPENNIYIGINNETDMTKFVGLLKKANPKYNRLVKLKS